MKTCPNCAKTLPDDAVFCDECGTSLDQPIPDATAPELHYAETVIDEIPPTFAEPEPQKAAVSAKVGQRCPVCGAPFSIADASCEYCGAPLPVDVVDADVNATDADAQMNQPNPAPPDAAAVPSSPPVDDANGSQCPDCGEPFIEDGDFCSNCGRPLKQSAAPYNAADPLQRTSPADAGDPFAGGSGWEQPVRQSAVVAGLTCAQCGTVMEPGSSFCDNCGATVQAGVAPVVTGGADMRAQAQGYSAHPDTLLQSQYVANASGGSHTQIMPDDMWGAGQSNQVGAGGYVSTVSARLVILRTSFPLPLPGGKNAWLIGRGDPINGVFPDVDLTDHAGERLGVSRSHARISMQGNAFYVEDLRSMNHTYVNRQFVQPGAPCQINPGDVLRLGEMELTFEI